MGHQISLSFFQADKNERSKSSDSSTVDSTADSDALIGILTANLGVLDRKGDTQASERIIPVNEPSTHRATLSSARSEHPDDNLATRDSIKMKAFSRDLESGSRAPS